MSKPTLNFHDLAYAYCDRQESTPEELLQTLNAKRIEFQPEGFLLLECADFSSSRLGEYTVLPYGPNNSVKTIPERPISPRGLASDMSTVVGVLPADLLLALPPAPVETLVRVTVESQVNCYIQGVNEEAYSRQKRESGKREFKPRRKPSPSSSRKSKRA